MPNTHSLSAEHRRHDRLLVARFAVGDAGFGQEHEAQDLVRRCSECAALAADISAISKSVARMPAQPRPRDFRLTAEQAALLRGSRVDRWLRTITGSGWSTVRPVAAVALSIGLVMSVVGFLPAIGAAPGPGVSLHAPAAADAPTPEGVSGRVNPPGLGVESPTTAAADNIDNAYLPQPTAAAEQQPGDADYLKTVDPTPGTSASDVLLLAGLSVTVLALVVLALLYAARQRFYDPLLR